MGQETTVVLTEDRNCHSRPGYPFPLFRLDVDFARVNGQSAVRSEPDHFASYRRSRRAHGERRMWVSEPAVSQSEFCD